jgi:hypothetical protein
MSTLTIDGTMVHKWTSKDDAAYAKATEAFDGTVGAHSHWAEVIAPDGVGDQVFTLDPDADTFAHPKLVGG